MEDLIWRIICFIAGCLFTFSAGVASWYHLELEKRKKDFNDSMNPRVGKFKDK